MSNSIMLSLSTYLSFLLEQYDTLTTAIVLASHNIVGPTLLTPSELQKVLDQARDSFNFNPLYETSDLDKYYHVLDVKIVGGNMFVFVPFASAAAFQLYHLVPFPTLLNNSIVAELDIEDLYILIDENFEFIAIANHEYFKESCFAIASQDYLCHATSFHFYPAAKFDCLLNLATQSRVSHTCNFRKTPNKTMDIHHSPPYNYFFLLYELKLTLTCGGDPNLVMAKGNFVIHESCGVSAPNVLKIFPSRSQTVDAKAPIGHYKKPVILRPLKFDQQVQEMVYTRLATEKPIPVPENDLWLQMRDAQPYFVYAGTPLALILVILLLLGIARLIYKRKLHATIVRVRALYKKAVEQDPHPDEEGPTCSSSATQHQQGN